MICACLGRLALVFALVLCSSAVLAKTVNGFDLSGASVPASEISQGGPPRDGIPAIDQPKFVAVAEVDWLEDDALVLGLQYNDQTRAYPIEILNWHELVNDVFGDQGVLISFCPLCGTGMAFNAEVEGERLDFGVSGLLHNSDILFYDRQSDSLWSQIKREAITGRWQDIQLQQLPLEHTTWKKWREANPQSQVLDNKQGFSRNYKDDPYSGYEKTRRLFFKVAGPKRGAYHPKERVLGLVEGDQTLAIPFVELRSQAKDEFTIDFSGEPVTIVWDEDTNTATAKTEDGQIRVHTIAFWFAWSAFHPKTEVFKAD